MQTHITGHNIAPKVHREYFLREFKKRFASLNYKEEFEQKGNEEQIILTIGNTRQSASVPIEI